MAQHERPTDDVTATSVDALSAAEVVPAGDAAGEQNPEVAEVATDAVDDEYGEGTSDVLLGRTEAPEPDGDDTTDAVEDTDEPVEDVPESVAETAGAVGDRAEDVAGAAEHAAHAATEQVSAAGTQLQGVVADHPRDTRRYALVGAAVAAALVVLALLRRRS